jgi:hypothetical protein
MDTSNINVGSLLIVDDTQSLEGKMASAIRCIFLDEKTYRFKKMNVHCNGEEFFLTKQALESSHWILAPLGVQLRFT